MPHIMTQIDSQQYMSPLIPSSDNIVYHKRIDSTTAYEHMLSEETGLSGSTACKILMTWNVSIDWSNSDSTYQHIIVLDNEAGSYQAARLLWQTTERRYWVTLGGSTSKSVTYSGYTEDTLNNCYRLEIGPRRTPKEIVYFHFLDVWIWT